MAKKLRNILVMFLVLVTGFLSLGVFLPALTEDAFGSPFLQAEAASLKIKTQPVSVTVPGGKTAKVTVGATGDGLTYKWYYKDAGSSKFQRTTAFKGKTYSVEMNHARDDRQVYCVVTDRSGKSVTTKTVSIHMGNPLKLVKSPASTAAKAGKTAKVSVQATGDGLTYKWYYKSKGDSSFKATSAFKGSSYTLVMNEARNCRKVYCVITDRHADQPA